MEHSFNYQTENKDLDLNKVKKWWMKLNIDKQLEILIVDIPLIIKQLQNSKKLKSCNFENCKCIQASEELSPVIEEHFREIVEGKKENSKQISFGSFLVVEKNKVSVKKEYLQEKGNQFFEILKKCLDIFPDDNCLSPSELPSPNNTHLLIKNKLINIRNLFRDIIKKEKEGSKSNSGRLLFQVYLARLFSHFVFSGFKEKVSFDLQIKLISECQKEKKKKKNSKKKMIQNIEEEDIQKDFEISNLLIGSFPIENNSSSNQRNFNPIGFEIQKNQAQNPFTVSIFEIKI